MDDNRVFYAKRNILSGVTKQIFNIILPFAVRTVVLYTFGIQYQGISGLFSSILQVLNLGELGLSTAVTYVLYKPIANHDKDRICAISNFLKKIYRTIGIIILIIGLLLTFFLNKLIAGSYPKDINIYVIYIIYLSSTAFSYILFAHKNVLLIALQRNDLVDNTYTVVTAAVRIAQIIVAFTIKNYYLFTLLLLIGTICNNITIEIISRKYFVDLIPKGFILPTDKQEIMHQVKGVFIGQIGDVARNSLDNIIISAFWGLSLVAIYDNYYYIYSAVYGLVRAISNATTSTVGNSIVLETTEKNYSDIRKSTFILMWIVGWCTTCLVCLYQPFMYIWMNGNVNLMFSQFNMILMCLYFYAINMNNTRNVYLTAAGLHPMCKKWFVIEALANLVLNIVLGKLLGISGIIIATIVTIVIFNFIARTNVLFKNYFKISTKEFYLSHLLYLVITLGSTVCTYLACDLIKDVSLFGFVLRIIVCAILPNLIYLLVYNKTDIFRDAVALCKGMLNTKKILN